LFFTLITALVVLYSYVLVGIQIDKIEFGSIVIMARPTGPSSFQKLEQNCRSGKIKNFIPQLFVGKAVGRVLEAGEYRLAFTIYSIPTANKQGNKVSRIEIKQIIDLNEIIFRSLQAFNDIKHGLRYCITN
jgi:hypothetical protein